MAEVAGREVMRLQARDRRRRERSEDPLLIVGSVVGPLDDGRSVGGAGAADVDRLAAVYIQDLEGSVARGAERPLLAVVIVRRPDLDDRAVAGGGTRDFEQLAAGEAFGLVLSVAQMGELPLLAVAATPAPLDSIRAVGGSAGDEVDNLVALAAREGVGAVGNRASGVAP